MFRSDPIGRSLENCEGFDFGCYLRYDLNCTASDTIYSVTSYISVAVRVSSPRCGPDHHYIFPTQIDFMVPLRGMEGRTFKCLAVGDIRKLWNAERSYS